MARSTSSAPRLTRRGFLAVLLLGAVAAALIVYKTLIAVSVGPGWDTYAFLSNAAVFAGRGYGYSELHRPPVISLLTALAWRLGAPMQESVIQWVDAALSLSGILAFYLLARKRFSAALSFVGALAFFALTPLWFYLGYGYTDLGSVGFSLWVLLALIRATEDNPWYYVAAGLLFLAAVMTRYTALLVAFPALVFLVLRGHIFRHAKAFVVAILVTVAAYVPIGRMYAARFGDALFPFIIAFTLSEEVTAPSGEGATRAAGWFYLRNLGDFLAPHRLEFLGWILVGVGIVGLGVTVGSYISALRPTRRRLLLAAGGLAIMLAGQMVGGLAIRQATIMAGVWLLWRPLAPREDLPDGRTLFIPALDAMLVAWFLAYFSFHGNQAIQVPRYLVAMAPGLIWLLMLGWQGLAESLGRALDSASGKAGALMPIARLGAPIGMGLLLAISIGVTAARTPRAPDPLVAGARDSAQWMMSLPPAQRASGPVYSDLWPVTAWYGRFGAVAMPPFKDPRAYGNELAKSNAGYFVTIRARRFPDFNVAQQFGAVTVLQRTRPNGLGLPNVAYLGKAWDNYLETVSDYSFFLKTTAGRYGWEGSAFMDSMTAQQLASYDAVAMYGVRWRDRAAGEAVLRDYVSNGGSLVIDASANLGALPYEFNDTVMFDTVMKRGAVPRDAAIHVTSDFASAHPEIGQIDPTPWVNETGGGWFGAEYSPLVGTQPAKVLATVGGKPLVTVIDVGNGRVYWIGYNLVWHAFLTGNSGEARLVKAVFADAIAHAQSSRSTIPSAGAGPAN
jgi:hypothetical protein